MWAAQTNKSSLPSLGSLTHPTSFSTTQLLPSPPKSRFITSSELGASTTARITALLTVANPFCPNAAPFSPTWDQYLGGEASSTKSNSSASSVLDEEEELEVGDGG